MATFDGNNATTDTPVATAGNSASHTGVQNGDYSIALGEVPRDDEAPQIYNFGPSTGADIEPGDDITFDIEDVDPGTTAILITIKYANIDTTFVVYDGTQFVAPYDDASTLLGDSSYYNVSLNHNNGWPAEIEALSISATDGDGNTATETVAYGVPNASPGPAIVDISPTTNTAIDPDDVIEFEVTDSGGDLQTVVVFLKFADSAEVFTVYTGFGSDIEYPFVGSVSTNPPNGLMFSFAHVEAWPGDIEALTVLARDAAGNVLNSTWAYTVPTATPGAPTITVVSPTPGVAAGQPGGFPADPDAAAIVPIVLDVVDPNPGNRLVVVVARYLATDAEEVVYRRGQFRGNYIAGSSQLAITSGVRLTCRRDGGWPGSPTFEIDAVDADGNLAS